MTKVGQRLLPCLLGVCLAGGCVGSKPLLIRIPPGTPPEVAWHIWQLYDPSPQVRAQACLEIQSMDFAAAAVPYLIGELADQSMAWKPSVFWPYTGSPVSYEAVYALANIGEPAVEPLIAALGHRRRSIRAGAAECLGEIGDARAADALLAALEDDEQEVREAARAALAGIPDPRAVLFAVARLENDFRVTQLRAFQTLSEIGPAARDALPALLELYHRPSGDGFLRDSAAWALGRIDAEAIMPELLERLAHPPDPAAALNTIRILGRIGPPARAAVPILRRFLESTGKEHRVEAAAALWRITGDAREPLAVLLDAVAWSDTAAWALGNMGAEQAEQSVPALVRALGGSGRHKAIVARALGAIGPAAAPAASALTELLTDPRERESAARALGLIGSAAEPALPALGKMSRTRDFDARQAARDAIRRIRMASNGDALRPGR